MTISRISHVLSRFAAAFVFIAVMAYGAGVGLTGSLDLAQPAAAQTQGAVPGQALGNTSDAELWRQLRRGEAFKLSHPSLGTAVLNQSQGESWRALRNGPLSTWGGYLLGLAVVAIVAFFLLRGRVLIENPTGRMVERFTMSERMAHWAVAILFVLLGVTGLIILYGKYVLVPVIGAEAFAIIASASLQAHNLVGPLFGLALLAMLFIYVKDNIPNVRDLVWIVRGGILFRHGVPSGKYNIGEKTWFWIAIIGGALITASGLFLVMPGILEGTRETQQLANLVHGGAAVVCIAAAIGHVYLGTVGVEGAFDGMVTGEVDESWAFEHHSDWAEDVTGTNRSDETMPHGAPAE